MTAAQLSVLWSSAPTEEEVVSLNPHGAVRPDVASCKEEFFELVATAQARRLDDQRARLGRSPPPKPRARSLRGSLRQLSLARRTPAPVAPPAPKEDLLTGG
ncbi:unnamed protein product [Menidia menidia]|uniref:(Atlantic silverside) hypothetical protein n=1 Tax=Menidia menidia TaxID=238744 RepID=A0A8S4BXW0_9TELE|nr:unnamed protein product [Menidia menidia]